MRDATIDAAVLVLNASFEPIQICSARRAFALIVKEKAIVKEHTDHEVCKGFKVPSVLLLVDFAKIPRRTQLLSRRNILLRDHHTCMYCGAKPGHALLTLDHVIPRAQGGKDTWENLVACCEKCNRFKADKTPEQAGMMLIRRPRPATIHTSRHILRRMGAEDERWKKYMYYHNTGSTEHVTLG